MAEKRTTKPAVEQPARIPPSPAAVQRLTMKRQGVNMLEIKEMARLMSLDAPWHAIKTHWIDVDDAALERLKPRVELLAAELVAQRQG